MTFQIYLNGEWVDYSSYILTNPKLQHRADQAFATGQCQVRCSRATNIPPYTVGLFEGEFVLVSSQVEKYLTYSGLYIHSITFLDPTALLELYTIGSKALTSTNLITNDYNKIQYELGNLLKQKYGIEFSYYQTGSAEVYTSMRATNNEYVFGNGTTFFAALCEIFERYDAKPKVVGISVANGVITNISYTAVKSGTTATLDESLITNAIYSQDTANYGKYLETEASNVVDRDNSIWFYDLTCRGDSVLLNADEAKVQLPLNVEAITRVVARSSSSMTGTIDVKLLDCPVGIMGDYDSGYSRYVNTLTIQQLIDSGWVADLDGEEVNVWEYIYNNQLKQVGFTTSTTLYMITQYDSEVDDLVSSFYGTYNSTAETYSNDITLTNLGVDLTSKLKEVDEWQGLSVSEKPQYAVYDSGDKYIYNLNATYKEDLINTIIGTSVGNVFEQTIADTIYFDRSYPNLYGYSTFGVLESELSNNPLDYTYDVECVPITNPLLRDTKTDTPINESSWKEGTRTYENSAQTIDFNMLVDSMAKTNEMLGKAELQLEYSGTPPSVGSTITYNSKTWYVMSTETTYLFSKNTTLINLCDSYYKIAEAIGVAYQFNSTANPLNNIITRPIYIEGNLEESFLQDLVNGKAYLRLITYNNNEAVLTTLYKRCAVMTAEGSVYFYVEAQDQYAFDKKAIPASSSIYECREIPYGDDNNEILKYRVSIGYISSMTRSQSLSMPTYTGGNFVSYWSSDMLYLYKDSREHITFTIKLKEA